jgi:outer membrane receptor protein involved in Fe transport
MNISAKTRKPGGLYACLSGAIESNKPFIRQLMRVSVVITLILLTTFQVLLATSTKGQNMHTDKVTIGLRDESLASALKKIEQQTPLRFYYRKADIKMLTGLNLPVQTRTIEQTLQELLKNTFFSFRQVENNILLERDFQQTDYQIKGRVVDIHRQPVAFATVSIRKAPGYQMVQGTRTDTGGYFKLVVAARGDYLVSISAVGMDSLSVALTLADQQLVPLPDIVLSTRTTNLREVSIVSKRPFIEQKIDRTVVNVDALISNAGSSAIEVLEKSPGVIVDQNGAISLKGKNNVKVFVDDKPTYLSGTELENYLRSLSSSTIDQIELMTNPPAKYDASGTGGVINIRTKRSKTVGFNGGLNLSYSQGRFGKTNNSFNFNYRNNKINVFGNLGYSTGINYNNLDINRHFENPDGSIASNFLQQSYIQPSYQNYSARLAMDYYLSDKTTLGIGFTGLVNPGDTKTRSTSQLSDAQNNLDSTIAANNREHRHFSNEGVNLNYRHQYDRKGQELTADLDYLNYDTRYNQSFDNTTYLPDGSVTNEDLLTGNLPSRINIYSVKSDYTHPLDNGYKLAAGVKTSYTKTDNIADYFNTAGSVTTPDYNKTNHFIYKETINAAYLNLNKDFKRVSLQAGLRFENTISDGHQLGNVQKPDSVFKRTYNGLFPTFYLQYKLDTAGNQTFGLNYGRRIDRPDYADLNPFLSPVDKFTYYTGNPFLNPSYTQSLELSHNYKNITTTLSYSKTRDAMYETIYIQNGIYYSKPGNIGSAENFGLSIDAGFDPAKWLSAHFYGYGGANHTVSNFYTGPLNVHGTLFILNPMLQFKPGASWTMQLDGRYQSPHQTTQLRIGDRKTMNAAVSKRLSASTTVKLVVNDVFHSWVNTGTINNLALTRADFHNVIDSRTAVISLSYRFGKTIANQRKHEANGAESEQNRVKQ